ncbi:EI24 domain-containing protein [bacterium]|nr:EI24 domain-containing protein [bacterium]
MQRMSAMPGKVSLQDGTRAVFRAIGFLVARPKYLAFCMAPFALNLLITLPLTLWLVFRFIYEPITGTLPQDGNWFMTALGSAASFLLFVVLIVVALIVFLVMSIILSAPFHDKISEWVERERFALYPDLMPPQLPISSGIRHALFEAVKRVSIALPPMIFVLALGFIPVAGSIIAVLLNTILAAQFLTLDAMSYSMDRREIPMGAKVKFLRNNVRYSIGFGLPFLALPCAIFIVPPISAVAGSLVFCDLMLEAYEKKELETEDQG